ncbi:hypothetical protein UNPF46_33210 [Bradyrhizobium sp. UNPF46]|uniref:DUF2252 family protein n=1 Tax=Bradyrhizobium sp. UNPF46 TaxID=1141168 RepID=UPI00114E2A00|nr:DUF2252 family protein [Bradyrhizobium sp. UNPF46]TQF26563.1 hypothetical protein UNPF46_33210 [Bradyrhizobium sp. UNPF46]
MSILEDTEEYETWLRRQCEVVENDLAHKHERMRENAFAFLRATYYHWARRIETICPDLADAPSTLCVGDIHLENFGTWRDADGRWVWGVNDFDEAAVMPYAFDLVRLVASAELAPKLKIVGRDAVNAILEGYRAGLRQPRPALLDEQEIWIRHYVRCSDRCRRKFWKDVDGFKAATPSPSIRKLLVANLPDGAKDAAFFRRRAGGGSLGRPRFVVVATWRGGRVVREAKALVPSAWDWSHRKSSRRHRFLELSTGAYRAPDPYLDVEPDAKGTHFVFRRLTADSRKINLDDDAAGLRYEQLRAMGADLAAVHTGTGDVAAAITKDLKARRSDWLYKNARAAREATEGDFEVWRRISRKPSA